MAGRRGDSGNPRAAYGADGIYEVLEERKMD
jgi:hypothetical protein